MTIRLTEGVPISGVVQPSGTVLNTLARADELTLTNGGRAVDLLTPIVVSDVTARRSAGQVRLADAYGDIAPFKVGPSAQPLREFFSLTDVTNSATGGTVTASIDTASPFGGPALKLAFGASVTQHDLTIAGHSLANFTADQGKMVWLLYFDDPRAMSQIQVFFGTDSLARACQYNYSLANNNFHNAAGEHVIAIHPDNASTNTVLTTDTVTTARLRFQRSASASSGLQIINAGDAPSATATNVWVKGVYIPQRTAPFLAITWDDADVSWWSRLRAILKSRGIKNTFGVNKDDVGTNAGLFVSRSQLDTLYSEGHEIASHNLTNTAITVAGIATYAQGFRTCRDWELGNGWTGRLDYHPYVQGAHYPDGCKALQNEGVKFGRTIEAANCEPLFLDRSSLMLPVLQFGSALDLAGMQTRVRQAYTRGQDCIAMGHIVADTSSSSVTIGQTILEQFLDWAIAEVGEGRLAGVGSIGQWAAYRGLLQK